MVFGDIKIDEPSTHFIHLFDLRTGKLTSLPGSAALRTAHWSPDGCYVAALQYEERKLVLFNSLAPDGTILVNAAMQGSRIYTMILKL